MNENRAVIAGAGVMGASLAQVYALAGYETVLYNRGDEGQIGRASCRERV